VGLLESGESECVLVRVVQANMSKLKESLAKM